MTTSLDTTDDLAAEQNADTTASPTRSDTQGVDTQPEAVFMSPADLVIDENVRKSFDLGDYPEVTDSIRNHGVLNPIKAHRESDGTVTVVDGQVRTLTALAFDLPSVPVWVTAAPAVDHAERAISRIAQQINVNDYRIALTEGDRAAGMAQMFAFGASLTRISTDLGRKRDQVKLAVTVGTSDTARRMVDTGQLDFEQAALIAEYEDRGDTDAVARLLAATRTDFSYESHRIAADRAESRDMFLHCLPYAAQGFGVLRTEPGADDQRFISAEDLRTADGTELTDDQIHAAAPAWVVYCEHTDEQALFDRDSGEMVDPDVVDWHTEGQPGTAPADGLRHADSVERRRLWTAAYFLRADQLENSGLRPASEFTSLPEEFDPEDIDEGHAHGQPGDENGIGDTDDDADPIAVQHAAEEQAEARRIARAKQAEETAARKEEERQAARRVRELNKQGHASLEARREFVTGFLTRKTLPPLAAVFVAESLADEPGLLSEYNADRTAQELLGITGWRSELLKTISTAKPARCHVIILALVLGGYEKRTGKDAWRFSDRGVRRYLHFLADNGHHLTPVEQAAAGDLDPNTIDIDS